MLLRLSMPCELTTAPVAFNQAGSCVVCVMRQQSIEKTVTDLTHHPTVRGASVLEAEEERNQADTCMRLLQVTGTLDPTYGGPPVVLNQLTRSLTQLGHSVDVVTLDPPSAAWLTEIPGHLRALGPAQGTYGYSPRLRKWLGENVSNYDAIIVHGIWRYESRAVRQACTTSATPYFVFVHGALDPWFRERYPGKHAKKWLYWQLSEHRSLSDARAVLFTQNKERDLARQSFTPYALNEAVVSIGIEEPPGDADEQGRLFYSEYPELRGKRILLFLSRLHPKKGCDLLIEAFARVSRRDERLQLVIAGPDECGLESELKELSRKLGVADRVTWPGMLSGEVKWGAYRAAEVFVLISHSENFGIVIAEAMACALPVLTTDKVNISREIVESGGGLVETDTVEGAERLMKAWLDRSDVARADMRRRARSCFIENFGTHKAASGFAQFITHAIEN